MRDILIMVFAWSMITVKVNACSCGASGSGGNYPGILPQFHKNIIGLRWSHAGSDISILTDGGRTASRNYNSVELWTRFYPSKRLQLFAFLPIVFNTQVDGDLETGSKGVGDVLLIAKYSVVETSDSSCRRWRHALLAGGGIKIPTGRSDLEKGDELIDPSLQPGSGSVDFVLNATYTVRYKQFGAQADVGYRVNLGNRNDYRFGNRFSGAAKLFYWLKAGRLALLPNAGIFYEHIWKDVDNDKSKYNSGGDILYATAGIDLYYGRFAIGFSYQQPAYQYQAYGEMVSKSAWLVNTSFLF